MSTNALTAASELPTKLNLIGLGRDALTEFFDGLGEKSYRAQQIMGWLYRRGVLNFEEMTDISLRLRRRLELAATLTLPEVIRVEESSDVTRKWLLDVGAGQAVETVFIPEANRNTLCISSQAGCALDCSFCATGREGFNRNLSAAEILGQVLVVKRAIGPEIALSNIVFMGMGEPLANYRNVVPVAKLLIDDYAFGLSRRRVTISTAGLVPQLHRLAGDCNVALAVSLHAASDPLRDVLVPINRRHPIGELLDACWHYAACLASRHVTFEYVMLRDVNDSRRDARRLAGLLRNRPAKVNLIPFNTFPGARYECSAPDIIENFSHELRSVGIVATIRRTRGDDIAAACGQLAGQVKDRTRVRLGARTFRSVRL
ncbi:MAG: 23S rRNA (adenine(2503)-C(2))-methyltransferase RlmN [Phycisphaerales bacterium]